MRSYRDCRDELLRFLCTDCSQRRNHCRARSNAVIDHDDNATLRIDGRTQGCVPGAPLPQSCKLPLLFRLEILRIHASGIVGYDRVPAVVDCADRQLELLGVTKLMNYDDIQIASERVSNDLCHGHTAPRDSKNQRMLVLIDSELASQQAPGVASVSK